MGAIPASECKDASAVEAENGLIPGHFGATGASACPARMAEVGWIRTVGLLPLLPARQTEDECREVRRQTGNTTSIKR